MQDKYTVKLFPKAMRDSDTIYVNRGCRELLADNYSVIYKADEKNKKVSIVTVQYCVTVQHCDSTTL